MEFLYIVGVNQYENPPTPQAQPATFQQTRFPAFPGATDILLIRHGQSEAYVAGTPFPLVDGHGDPALSEDGEWQAQQLADRLAGAGIDTIYVSTLRRTAQTAAPLASRLGLAPQVEAGLREVHLGDWEGGTYRQMVAQRHPLVAEAWEQERWDVIPGAEPAGRFRARVRAAVERLARAHPGQRVAAFSHGGVIGEVLSIATGSRPFAFTSVDNASISRLVIVEERWILRGFNDTAHLEASRLAGTPPGR